MINSPSYTVSQSQGNMFSNLLNTGMGIATGIGTGGVGGGILGGLGGVFGNSQAGGLLGLAQGIQGQVFQKKQRESTEQPQTSFYNMNMTPRQNLGLLKLPGVVPDLGAIPYTPPTGGYQTTPLFFGRGLF